jgi:NAD(P)-dependent dehydrogenase (short-subunit alcohol dehydrogenase family)
MIRVNLLAPVVTSPGYDAWYEQQTPEQKAKFEERTKATAALGRMGPAQEAGDVNVFLLSDLSRYLTGQILYADGGRAFGR